MFRRVAAVAAHTLTLGAAESALRVDANDAADTIGFLRSAICGHAYRRRARLSLPSPHSIVMVLGFALFLRIAILARPLAKTAS